MYARMVIGETGLLRITESVCARKIEIAKTIKELRNKK